MEKEGTSQGKYWKGGITQREPRMRENNLYPFGGDPVRKRNRNPGTGMEGDGNGKGMRVRMYATGERNKPRVDALTSRRTVSPTARLSA